MIVSHSGRPLPAFSFRLSSMFLRDSSGDFAMDLPQQTDNGGTFVFVKAKRLNRQDAKSAKENENRRWRMEDGREKIESYRVEHTFFPFSILYPPSSFLYFAWRSW